MKKLSLKNLNLDANDLLQREQLRTIFGGYDGYGSHPVCKDECETDSDCTDPSHPDCTNFLKTTSCPDHSQVKNCI